MLFLPSPSARYKIADIICERWDITSNYFKIYQNKSNLEFPNDCDHRPHWQVISYYNFTDQTMSEHQVEAENFRSYTTGCIFYEYMNAIKY